jgi:hypothetical protein
LERCPVRGSRGHNDRELGKHPPATRYGLIPQLSGLGHEPWLSVNDRCRPIPRHAGGTAGENGLAPSLPVDGHQLGRGMRPVHADQLPRWQEPGGLAAAGWGDSSWRHRTVHSGISAPNRIIGLDNNAWCDHACRERPVAQLHYSPDWDNAVRRAWREIVHAHEGVELDGVPAPERRSRPAGS